MNIDHTGVVGRYDLMVATAAEHGFSTEVDMYRLRGAITFEVNRLLKVTKFFTSLSLCFTSGDTTIIIDPIDAVATIEDDSPHYLTISWDEAEVTVIGEGSPFQSHELTTELLEGISSFEDFDTFIQCNSDWDRITAVKGIELQLHNQETVKVNQEVLDKATDLIRESIKQSIKLEKAGKPNS